jgi:hypothetical protein
LLVERLFGGFVLVFFFVLVPEFFVFAFVFCVFATFFFVAIAVVFIVVFNLYFFFEFASSSFFFVLAFAAVRVRLVPLLVRPWWMQSSRRRSEAGTGDAAPFLFFRVFSTATWIVLAALAPSASFFATTTATAIFHFLFLLFLEAKASDCRGREREAQRGRGGGRAEDSGAPGQLQSATAELWAA